VGTKPSRKGGSTVGHYLVADRKKREGRGHLLLYDFNGGAEEKKKRKKLTGRFDLPQQGKKRETSETYPSEKEGKLYSTVGGRKREKASFHNAYSGRTTWGRHPLSYSVQREKEKAGRLVNSGALAAGLKRRGMVATGSTISFQHNVLSRGKKKLLTCGRAGHQWRKEKKKGSGGSGFPAAASRHKSRGRSFRDFGGKEEKG